MAFQKAQRKRSFLKMAITGPSGSGKTLSSLLLARGIAGNDGTIAVIDTENESSSLYDTRTDFDIWPLSAPFTPERYVEAIHAAVAGGYTVLVIDSLTHEWAGDGGLLAQKESIDARGGNSFTNWATITKKHEQFKAALLQAPIHVICTMRSKQEYVINPGNGGKATPQKVGTAPIQRDGMEYEFSLVFDVSQNHEAMVGKDRTGLFDGVVGVLSAAHGEKIRQWMDSGAASAPPPDPERIERIAAINAFADSAANHGYNGMRDRATGEVCKDAVQMLLREVYEFRRAEFPNKYTLAAWRFGLANIADLAALRDADSADLTEGGEN